MSDASNATFLCRLATPNGGNDIDRWPEDEAPAAPLVVYKPTRGERPLADFPDGTLAGREVAAYLVSQASGWQIVPLTVLRDGPFGPGMVQAWIETDAEVDLLELVMAGDPRLRPICLFDALVNNADRKGGHLLALDDGALMGVDHGICFAVEPKLRTVLWAWRGQPIEDDELTVLGGLARRLEGDLGVELAALLSSDEVAATVSRARALIDEGRFPQPDPNRPAVPFPPF